MKVACFLSLVRLAEDFIRHVRASTPLFPGPVMAVSWTPSMSECFAFDLVLLRPREPVETSFEGPAKQISG